METNEPVIGVTWQGSNRRINVYVFSYVSLAPAGDPLVDAGGFADGYTLPGSIANVPASGNPNRSGRWGSSNRYCNGVLGHVGRTRRRAGCTVYVPRCQLQCLVGRKQLHSAD